MTTTTLTRAELEEQITNIKARIERLAGRVAAGDMGEEDSLAVRRGRFVGVGRNESFLNLNRRALADREAKLAAMGEA